MQYEIIKFVTYALFWCKDNLFQQKKKKKKKKKTSKNYISYQMVFDCQQNHAELSYGTYTYTHICVPICMIEMLLGNAMIPH